MIKCYIDVDKKRTYRPLKDASSALLVALWKPDIRRCRNLDVEDISLEESNLLFEDNVRLRTSDPMCRYRFLQSEDVYPYASPMKPTAYKKNSILYSHSTICAHKFSCIFYNNITHEQIQIS